MSTDREMPFVKALATGRFTDDGYEPQPLWLIPIQLRSRIQYYQEVADRALADIERSWDASGRYYRSREEFDASDFVRHIWQRSSPFWWGLNDIIGFVDVRLYTRSVQIQAALFLTTKRPSRTLRDRVFVHKRHSAYDLVGGETNHELQDRTIALVRELAADPRLKRRHLDLPPWERSVRRTDLIGIFRDAVAADKTRA